MDLDLSRPQQNNFRHEGLTLSYLDAGDKGAPAVLMIHGFASSALVNWVQPGWVQTLLKAGYRTVAIDNRGHGLSAKPHEAALYTPSLMAGDAAALLDHLGIDAAHVMGYSMGARVSCFMALEHADRVKTLTLGGLGIGLVTGVGEWDPIAAALLAPSLDDVTHERGRMFRAFADKTGSDRIALAACISSNRILLTEAAVHRIVQPVLIAVGTKDDIAGNPHDLGDLLPDARVIDLVDRDHMLAVGDRQFKAAALEFLAEHRF